MPAAPIHHEGKPLDDAGTAVLVARVRASAVRATSAALDELVAALPGPIVSMSLRAWPLDFPEDVTVQRRPPYEARADSIMYRQVLAELARARGWDVHLYDAKDVEARAASTLARAPTRSCSVRGQRWGRPGQRTIGWRSRPRSWPDELGAVPLCAKRRRASLGTAMHPAGVVGRPRQAVSFVAPSTSDGGFNHAVMVWLRSVRRCLRTGSPGSSARKGTSSRVRRPGTRRR